MARPRNPAREKAKGMYLQANGKLTAAEIAGQLDGVKPGQVRKWKSLDCWDEEFEEQRSKRKRGGQPGNKNAAGAGAPFDNKNAETHGAYAAVHFEALPPEVQESIRAIDADPSANMLEQLRVLKAKEYYLQAKINELESQPPDAMYTDRITEMLAPAKKKGETKMAMTTVSKSSPFERAHKLEAELNKVQGRIIKLIDSMRAYELEQQRQNLERRKYNLMKQKISGVYDINTDTGEIDDTNDDIDIDIEGATCIEFSDNPQRG